MRLYEFQRVGAKWLSERRRGYLADEMGLGKTPQAIVAAAMAGVSHVLIVCPASVRSVWRAEIKKWQVRGAVRSWTIVGYEELVNIDRTGLAIPPHDLMVVDEAHYCKNPTAQRAKVVLTLANASKRIWFLSGTPMPNHPGELFTVFRSVWPDLIPSSAARKYGGWLDLFCKYRVGRHNNIQVYGSRNAAQLRDMLDKVMLRRKLDDTEIDLPEIRFEEMILELAGGVEAVPQVEWQSIELVATSGGSAAAMRHELGVLKAKAVLPILLDELENGNGKLVVLAYHREALNILFEGLSAVAGTAYMDGSSNDKQRTVNVRDFQEEEEVRVMVAQLTTAGVGITLHAAHEMVLVEPAWSPDDNLQAVKRIHRIGQDKPCRGRMCYVPGSIDEDMQRVRTRKLKMIGEIVHSYTEAT